MCGICGIIDFNGTASKKVLLAMLSSTAYRGPDSTGTYVSKCVFLGINRLKIIDLKTGDQPIENEDKSLVVIFNGELYNYLDLKTKLLKLGHKFKTRSDTEVLLHLYEHYGQDCPKYLSGMFAFAIWDKKNQSVFLARDHAGIKPLYYYLKDNLLVFASEPKALLLHPQVKNKVNRTSLATYLTLGYLPGISSMYEGISKLEPGTTLFFTKKHVTKKRYWSLSENNKSEPKSNLNNLLKTAVNAQTVSDVPWGVFLSGGLDSSLLTYYLSKSHKHIKTFAIGFTDSKFDEAGFAKQVADYFHTDHYQESFSTSDLLNSFSSLTSKLDEPIADASIFPTYKLSALARRHVTVALSGDGGDELFGGYPVYQGHLFAPLLSKVPLGLRRQALKTLALFPNLFGTYDKKEVYKQFFAGLELFAFNRHLSWFPQTNPQFGFPDLSALIEQIPANTPDALKFQMFDFLTYLEGDLLVKTDRASMFNSLEVRVPYLDPKVINFAFNSNNNHVDMFRTKKILRALAKDKLPPEIINRKKKGFGIPLSSWVKDDLKDLVGDMLSTKKLPTLVDKKILNHAKAEYRLTGQNYHFLWKLVMLSAWAENYS